MKRTTLTIVAGTVALAAGLAAGWLLRGDATQTEAASTKDGGREILYWVAPMDPNFRREEPGKSPMGMDLVPVYADDAAGEDTVTISPTVVNNLGVRTEEAEVRPLWERIEATGYVGFDETRITHVNLRIQGWIVRLEVNAEGERVSEGDLLFELYSPELVNAQKELLQAGRRGGARLSEAADQKLRALGMIRSEIDRLERTGEVIENIRFVAPRTGIVAALNVREGMYVQPNTLIMSLADLSTVWMQAEVFESQAELVAEGQAAEARLNSLPGMVFSGQVDYVYPVLDPQTRTLRVRLRFDNPGERLKPNMYASVSIFGRLHPNALSIPREALIRAPERDRVVVALGDGRFKVHEVISGVESGVWVEILAGLEPGAEVVTSAQFLLDSEASLTGSITRLDAGQPAEGTDEPVTAFASGRINEIDRRQRRLRVSHGPIDQLGWPSMTMEFDVDAPVDLTDLEVGQGIRFQLRQKRTGEFVISGLSGRRQGGTEPRPESGGAPIEGRGTIRTIDPEARILRMEHEPIAALEWPSMTMNFDVSPGVDLGRFHEGQDVRFTLRRQEDDRFVIDAIEPLSEQDHGHD